MDKNEMREGAAREYGISMFKRYSEPEAAHFLQIDLSTLKKMRRAGKVRDRSLGERQIRYLGIDIVDLILFGDKWRDIKDESTKSALTGSPSEPEAPRGTGLGKTPTLGKSDAFHLAQTILRKPSKD